MVCVIDQAGYGATAAAPVVRDIFSYLASHPMAPVVRPAVQHGRPGHDPGAAPHRTGDVHDHHDHHEARRLSGPAGPGPGRSPDDP